ncbi:MAG: hypothetical protein AAF899_05190 [Pseudomonadota bacterium]
MSLVLLSQYAHDYVVMPDLADARALALAPFFDETAGKIAASRSLIECEHPQIDPVQSQRSEGVRQNEPDHLSAQTLPKQSNIIEPGR